MIRIAEGYAEAGELIRALQIADEIEVNDDKASAYAIISGQYFTVGQKDKSLELLLQAFKIVNKNKDFPVSGDADSLTAISVEYAKAGEKEKAAEILSQATQNKYLIIDDYKYVKALTIVAGEYTKTKQKDKALELLCQALLIDRANITQSYLQAGLMTMIAGKFVETGQENKGNFK